MLARISATMAWALVVVVRLCAAVTHAWAVSAKDDRSKACAMAVSQSSNERTVVTTSGWCPARSTEKGSEVATTCFPAAK